MPVYGIDITAGASIGVVAAINGVPVLHHAGGDAFAASLPLQLDVVDGANRATVVATPRAGRAVTAGTPTPVDKQMFVTAKINVGDATGTGPAQSFVVREVKSVDWHPEKTGATSVTLPHTLTIDFTASGVTGEPIWRRAVALNDASVDADAMHVTREVLELLKARNVDGYAALVHRKYEEAARAFPRGGDAARQRWIDTEELRDVISQPNIVWSDPATLGPQFPRYAENRLIECLGRDGRPLIRGQARGAEEPILIGLMLAKLDGRLVPVR